MKLTLERDRPTDIARIGKLLLFAVPTVAVAVMFVAPLIARHQSATVSVGDSVSHVNPDTGFGTKGQGRVVEVRGNGDALVKRADGVEFVAHVSELHEF